MQKTHIARASGMLSWGWGLNLALKGRQEQGWVGELGTQGSVSMLGHCGGIQNIGLVGETEI